MRQEKLDEIKQNIELIKALTVEDATIAVFDTEGVALAFYPPKKALPMDFKVGYKAPAGDKIYEVMKTGVSIYNKVPKDIIGVPFEGKIHPIYDEGKIVGVITYTFSTEVYEEIEGYVKVLKDRLGETNTYTTNISECATDLLEQLQEIQDVSELVEQHIKEVTDVASKIQKNASYSNILALNASIESARAGQAGRGFAVVADEMGKFSKSSGILAEQINKAFKDIIEVLTKVNQTVRQSTKSANEQIEVVNEIVEAYKEVIEVSEKLRIANSVRWH